MQRKSTLAVARRRLALEAASLTSVDDHCSERTSANDPEATADRLVELVLSGGGRDNVSVVVAEICG